MIGFLQTDQTWWHPPLYASPLQLVVHMSRNVWFAPPAVEYAFWDFVVLSYKIWRLGGKEKKNEFNILKKSLSKSDKNFSQGQRIKVQQRPP